MSDKPILFQAPMVRGLLREAERPGEGKTQTRRLPTLYRPAPGPGFVPRGVWCAPGSRDAFMPVRWAKGDRLWVKERGAVAACGLAFQPYVGNEASMEGGPKNPCWPRSPDGTPYKPRVSIHMPRWASRLTLIVSDVRVERLQGISEADAPPEDWRSIARDVQTNSTTPPDDIGGYLKTVLL